MAAGTVPILSGDEAQIAQICVVVPDVERSLAARARIGGAEGSAVWRYEPDDFALSAFRGRASPFAELVALVPGTPVLEFVQPLLGPSVFHEHIDEHGYGLHHVGVTVADLGAVTQAMEDAGFPVVQRLGGWGVDGDGEAAFFDTRSTLGCWLEAVTPATQRRPPLVTL
jgi:catechol 2,3-dioxygenase-like lactoylglutathione lyase family enzyme